MAVTTLNAYAAVIYSSARRYTQNHFVFVPTMVAGSDDANADLMTATILAHPIIAGRYTSYMYIIRVVCKFSIECEVRALVYLCLCLVVVQFYCPSSAHASDIPNILIIVERNCRGCYDLITSRFVGRNVTASTDPVRLDTFNGLSPYGNASANDSIDDSNNSSITTAVVHVVTATTGRFRQNASLFPDKFTDLKGRIVRMAMFNYKPYTVWEKVVSPMCVVVFNVCSIFSEFQWSFVHASWLQHYMVYIEYIVSFRRVLPVSAGRSG